MPRTHATPQGCPARRPAPRTPGMRRMPLAARRLQPWPGWPSLVHGLLALVITERVEVALAILVPDLGAERHDFGNPRCIGVNQRGLKFTGERDSNVIRMPIEVRQEQAGGVEPENPFEVFLRLWRGVVAEEVETRFFPVGALPRPVLVAFPSGEIGR